MGVGRTVKQDVAGFSCKMGEWEKGAERWGSETKSSTIVTEWQTHPLGLITMTIPVHN